MTAATARLAITALEAVEFTPNDIWAWHCYWCKGYARHPAMDQDYYGKAGHKSDCPRQLALAALRKSLAAVP